MKVFLIWRYKPCPQFVHQHCWHERNWHLEHGSKRQWIRMHKMRMSDRVPDSLQSLPGHSQGSNMSHPHFHFVVLHSQQQWLHCKAWPLSQSAAWKITWESLQSEKPNFADLNAQEELQGFIKCGTSLSLLHDSLADHVNGLKDLDLSQGIDAGKQSSCQPEHLQCAFAPCH